MKFSVHRILLSGGSGTRMGVPQPKQFLLLSGVPILIRSARTLSALDFPGQKVLVAGASAIRETQELLHSYSEDGWEIQAGGETRHQSCLRGIEAVLRSIEPTGLDIFLIHDAARPLVTVPEIARLIRSFEEDQNQVVSLVGPIHETIARVQDNDPSRLYSIEPRDKLRAVKTPQAFRGSTLGALTKTIGDFTDLLSWGEAAGIAASLVDGDPTNLKITSREDLLIAETIIHARS